MKKKRRRSIDNICWKYIRSIEVYYNLDKKFWFWIIFNSYISVIFIYIMFIKIKNYKITDDKVRWRLFQQVFRDRKKIILYFKKIKNLVTFPPINLRLLKESSFTNAYKNRRFRPGAWNWFRVSRHLSPPIPHRLIVHFVDEDSRKRGWPAIRLIVRCPLNRPIEPPSHCLWSWTTSL